MVLDVRSRDGNGEASVSSGNNDPEDPIRPQSGGPFVEARGRLNGHDCAMTSFEVPSHFQVRSPEEHRRRFVRQIRGWLRAERSPRLTIIGLLGIAATVALGAVYLLGLAGMRGWGMRSFWAVLAAWPVFVWLLRWRAGVEFGQMTRQMTEHELQFARLDELDDSESQLLREATEAERACHRAVMESSRGAGPLTLLLLGGVTLGCFLIWDLVQFGPTLLAETIFDAEMVIARPDLILTTTHRDWRAEAFGATGIHFGGLAIAACCIGATLPFLILY